FVYRVISQPKDSEGKLRVRSAECRMEGAECGTEGKGGRQSALAKFSCWCPKAISRIGRLPETLADRCIVIRMQRKTSRECCERLRKLEPSTLKEGCERFVGERAEEIAAAAPEIPPSLNDRAADIWEPLLIIADLAGGEWPGLARQAAIHLSATAE